MTPDENTPDAFAETDETAAEPVLVDALETSMTALASVETGTLTATQSAIGSADVSGDAEFSTSAVGMLSAKGDAAMRQGLACALMAERDVSLTQAAAGVVVGEKVTMDHSFSGALVSSETEVRQSRVVLLLSRSTTVAEGSRVIFDWKAALILAAVLAGFAGIAAALGFLLVRKGVSDGEIREVLLRIATRGVCHVPSINSMFVTSFQVEFGAEEAARFVHHACQGTLSEAADPQPQASEDRFYRRVLQEALAFLGSRVLYPARAAVRESDLYVLYAQPREAIEEQTVYSYREYMEMIDFLVLHKDFESNSYRHAPELIRTGVHYTGRKFEYVTETLGQMLGNQLYEAYISGRIAKRFLRSLFLRRLDRPGGASAAYYAAARKIAGKPKRFRVM